MPLCSELFGLMREVPIPENKPARQPVVWPHIIVLAGEAFLIVCAFDYLSRKQRGDWGPVGAALAFVLGALTVYQTVQTLRRKVVVLRVNRIRCQLFLAIGVAGAGASHTFDEFTLTMITWGLLSLWAYASFNFVKRPFDQP